MQFRGENINGHEKTDRTPDPERLCIGYHFAAITLSILRASCNQPRDTINSVIRPSSKIFTSHEALHLPFETVMTRRGYNTSAHMLWIGERTRQLDGAHVEYMRGIRNPVGIKLGPSSIPSQIVELLDILNPQKTTGRNILITRLGVKNVAESLPALIKAVHQSGHTPVWLCDPCHGNTVTTPSKIKTRIMEDVFDELKETHLIHVQEGSYLGGIHLEQTGEDDVTECIERSKTNLDIAVFPEHRSLCDPRLSMSQGKDLVRSYIKFVGELSTKNNVVPVIKVRDLLDKLMYGDESTHVLKEHLGILV